MPENIFKEKYNKYKLFGNKKIKKLKDIFGVKETSIEKRMVELNLV